MKCMICSSESSRLFCHDTFELFWCHDCEFGRLAGGFGPEQVRGFYTDGYYTHSSSGPPRAAVRPSFADRLLIHLAWRLDKKGEFGPAELPKGKTACDIGCGNGDILRHLKAFGYDAIGVEPDPKARAVASKVCKIYDGTAEDMPTLGEFDVVLMSHVLEHCIDPVKAVEKAKSLLSKSGTLVIEVPNNAALGFWWFKGRWPWTDIPRHLSFFTERSLRKLLNQFELQVTKVTYTGYVRQFTPEWRDKIGGYWSGWPLFLASSLARDRLKYDSIRLHARVGGD